MFLRNALAALLFLLSLTLCALSFIGNVFGPYEWTWFGLPAFFVTIPTILLFMGIAREGFLRPERPRWRRFCRTAIGGIAALCIGAMVAGVLGLIISMRGGGRINGGGEPLVGHQGPYVLSNKPVSRERWLAVAVSFVVVWHLFPFAWLMGLLFAALSEPKPLVAEPGSEFEPR
jgi:ABC-type sugar transport system permease subunit